MNKAISIDSLFWPPRRLPLIAMLSVAMIPAARGQECLGCNALVHPAEPMPENSWVIKKQVNEVSVFFTASIDGNVIPDLTLEDVDIRDDQQRPAAILEFHSQHDLPLRVGLLVDTSASVHDHMRLSRLRPRRFCRR